MHARIWNIEVGRISLYLLDTDFEENNREDRAITHHFMEVITKIGLNRKLILGIGGIRALAKINLKPNLYHQNEGHSAFIGLERIRT